MRDAYDFFRRFVEQRGTKQNGDEGLTSLMYGMLQIALTACATSSKTTVFMPDGRVT